MKLKKIASLMLAGVMAVSMLAGCNGAPIDNGGTNAPDEELNTSASVGKSAVFEAALGDLADTKITMSDSNALNTALESAAMNVGSATIIDFTTAIRSANTIRTIANFDQAGDVYVADVPNGSAGVGLGWSFTTTVPAGDLGVAAYEMNAQNVAAAFQTLIPSFQEVNTETVTMLFAVDGFIGVDAAVRQVATVLDNEIGALRIDDDNSADMNCGVDATTLHYSYTGAVSVMNRTLADNHGMGVNIIAVQITRTANA